MKHLRSFVLFSVALIVAACQSDSRNPFASGETGDLTLARGGGAGAQFLENTLKGDLFGDRDGDICVVSSSSAIDINDFIRVNPDGSMHVHVAEREAIISVTTSSNQGFAGPGHWTVSSGFFGGVLVAPTVFVASGRVTETRGTATRTAVCKIIVDANGNEKITIDVRGR